MEDRAEVNGVALVQRRCACGLTYYCRLTDQDAVKSCGHDLAGADPVGLLKKLKDRA